MATEPSDISNLYPTIKLDGIKVLDIWNAYTITQEFKNNTIAESFYIVESGDTWSSIAQKLYGERRLWWVIALFNDIEDPFQLYHDFDIATKISST